MLLAIRESDSADPALAFSLSGPFEAGAWSDTGRPCTVLGDDNLGLHGDDLRVDWSQELVGDKAMLPFGAEHEVEATFIPAELAPSVERFAEDRGDGAGSLVSVSAATGYIVAPADCPEPCEALTRVLVRHRLSAE